MSECRVVLRVEQFRQALLTTAPTTTAPARYRAQVSTTPPLTIDAVLVPHPIYRAGRLFLVCPACGHQIGRLYQPQEGWPLSCRRCHRLTYRSTQESKKLPTWLPAVLAGELSALR